MSFLQSTTKVYVSIYPELAMGIDIRGSAGDSDGITSQFEVELALLAHSLLACALLTHRTSYRVQNSWRGCAASVYGCA